VSVRFVADGAEVTLDDGLLDFVQSALAATMTATAKVLRENAEQVAKDARRDWYGPDGVKRKTGLSGDIQVRETIDIIKGEITVSVGSTDRRRAGGKPVPLFVHRPGRTSTVLQKTTPEVYFSTPEVMRGPWLPTTPKKTPQIFIRNPNASDGKKLIEVLVKAPMRKRTRAMVRGISEELRRNG